MAHKRKKRTRVVIRRTKEELLKTLQKAEKDLAEREKGKVALQQRLGSTLLELAQIKEKYAKRKHENFRLCVKNQELLEDYHSLASSVFEEQDSHNHRPIDLSSRADLVPDEDSNTDLGTPFKLMYADLDHLGGKKP